MGTYYSLGIISKFKASSHQRLTKEEWERVLNDRVDLKLCVLHITILNLREV